MRASCTICGTKFANSRILSWHLKTHFPKISFELNKTTQACISCKKLSDLLNENLCYSCTMVTPLSSNFHFNFFDIFYSYRLCKKTSLDFCPSIFYSTQKFGHIELQFFDIFTEKMHELRRKFTDERQRLLRQMLLSRLRQNADDQIWPQISHEGRKEKDEKLEMCKM